VDEVVEAPGGNRVTVVQFNDGEREVTVTALEAYRDETRHYLRGLDSSGQTHEDCCKVGKQRAAMARERMDALNARLREVDGALMALGVT
jgi:hypothetical protein